VKVKVPLSTDHCGTNLKPYSLATLGVVVVGTVFFVPVKIKINGEEKEFASGLSIGALLEQLQIRPGRVVVERNRDIVARNAYDATLLADSDILEIVHFVGGG
jgi:sulfur carrier protein